MNKLMKSQHVCEMFDISLSTLYLWVKKGKLPEPLVSGNRRYWSEEVLEEAREKMFSGKEKTICTAD